MQENIPIEEVFEQLKCTREGLSSSEGAQRLEIFGPNKLEEKKVTAAKSNLHKHVFVWTGLGPCMCNPFFHDRA